jgi:hypothetical protein
VPSLEYHFAVDKLWVRHLRFCQDFPERAHGFVDLFGRDDEWR